MHPFWFFLPATAATGLLVHHAATRRSRLFAIEFFLLAFAYFALRENLSAYGYFHRYDVRMATPFRIHKAHLGIVVGWLYTSYLSWTLAERVVVRFRSSAGALFPTVFVAMAVTSSIAYPVEVLGVKAGWWEWVVDGIPWSELEPVARAGFNATFVAIPPTPLLGWPIFAGGFLAIAGAAGALFPRRLALRLPFFAALSGLWFETIHSLPLGLHLWVAVVPVVFVVLILVGRLPIPESWSVRPRPPRPAGAPSRWTRDPVNLAGLCMVFVVLLAGLVRLRSPEVILPLLAFGSFTLLSQPFLGTRRALSLSLLAAACLFPFGPLRVLVIFTIALLPFPVLGLRGALLATAGATRRLFREFEGGG